MNTTESQEHTFARAITRTRQSVTVMNWSAALMILAGLGIYITATNFFIGMGAVAVIIAGVVVVVGARIMSAVADAISVTADSGTDFGPAIRSLSRRVDALQHNV